MTIISRKWVEAVNELVGCWSQLEGKIDELTKWVEASKSSDPGAQAGLSIDKLEEQLNVLKANFTEKQSLIEEMMAKCKVGDNTKCSLSSISAQAQNDGRRKSQVNMNVRRMTMLPVEEMRKLSQMVKVTFSCILFSFTSFCFHRTQKTTRARTSIQKYQQQRGMLLLLQPEKILHQQLMHQHQRHQRPRRR